MQLYVVYLFNRDKRINGGDGSLHNDECKGLYSTLEGALERAFEEQSRHPGDWEKYGNDSWECGNWCCRIVDFTDQNNQCTEYWFLFHGGSVLSREKFLTEEEARRYVHNDMRNPANWTETIHNQWACNHHRWYIKRFEILDEIPIKEAVDDY